VLFYKLRTKLVCMLSLPVAKTVVHRYHVYWVVRELQVFVTHTVTTM